MYSQDLPDWEYISRLSRIMIGFMACGFLFVESNTKSESLFH
jgi:hypothetical protein